MGRAGIIGLEPHELERVRTLLRLMRHPDPVVVELTSQALAYLSVVADRSAGSDTPMLPRATRTR